MPCKDDRYEEQPKENAVGAALACALLRRIAADGSVGRFLDGLDYPAAGITRAQAGAWWEQHKAADRKRDGGTHPPVPQPFASAEEAWFWTVQAIGVRQGQRRAYKDRGPLRPCDADDVIRALDGLYRQGRIGPQTAAVLRRYGERGTPPTGGSGDGDLWHKAMVELGLVLRPKGIVA